MKVKYSNRKGIVIKVDKKDVVDLDYTLGHIILEMLYKYQERMDSFPCYLIKEEDLCRDLTTEETISYMNMWQDIIDEGIDLFQRLCDNLEDLIKDEELKDNALEWLKTYYFSLWK